AATRDGEDPVLVVMPAEHVMTEPEKFRTALLQAIPLALEGRIVTFGIEPGAPETGYGYIQCGAAIGDDGASEIARFVEKPAIDDARRYLAEGGYLWNSGIYITRASTWLRQIGRFRADILAACEAAME